MRALVSAEPRRTGSLFTTRETVDGWTPARAASSFRVTGRTELTAGRPGSAASGGRARRGGSAADVDDPHDAGDHGEPAGHRRARPGRTSRHRQLCLGYSGVASATDGGY